MMTLWVLKCVAVAGGLGAWFLTQAWIGKRPFPSGALQDRVHDVTAPLNRWLLDHPRHADALLIATSALIDIVAIWLLYSAIFGPSLGPFIGLLLLFVLRQVCQGLCALPPPPGMIWRSPGFPSALVTYGTAGDLFFSGHTALAVYGGLELAHQFGGWGIAAGAAFVAIEAATVLVLRAHYTMDVLAGALAALWVWGVAQWLAPPLDALLAALAS
jgi:hypothetical protein